MMVAMNNLSQRLPEVVHICRSESEQYTGDVRLLTAAEVLVDNQR